MKIIYHEKFENPNYSHDPAASEGRIKCIREELERLPDLEFVRPDPADIEDLKLIHTNAHIEGIRRNDLLFRTASLAAGGAIKAAELAYKGEPTFALIRPPGHHASPNSAWGFCFFNNMGIALEKLRKEGKIESAYVLDFDLHTGDGNINSLGGKSDVHILNPRSSDREDYLEEVSEDLEKRNNYGIIGVSAGFDEHVNDWGGKLTTSDYRKLGNMVRNFSEKKCRGRRFALLEGGYNHEVLGKNVAGFVEGFQGSE